MLEGYILTPEVVPSEDQTAYGYTISAVSMFTGTRFPVLISSDNLAHPEDARLAALEKIKHLPRVFARRDAQREYSGKCSNPNNAA